MRDRRVQIGIGGTHYRVIHTGPINSRTGMAKVTLENERTGRVTTMELEVTW